MKVYSLLSSLMVAGLVLLSNLSLSLASPHQPRHRHHPLHVGRQVSTTESGSGLIFTPIEGNNTNDNLYVYSLRARELTTAQVTSTVSGLATGTAAQLPYISNPHQRIYGQWKDHITKATDTLQPYPEQVTHVSHTWDGVHESAASWHFDNSVSEAEATSGGADTIVQTSESCLTTTIDTTLTLADTITITPSLSSKSSPGTSTPSAALQPQERTASSSLCPELNATTYTDQAGNKYLIECSVDFPGSDLRYLRAGSFADCISACDTFNNQKYVDAKCAGVAFVPSRISGSNDCYLKSSLNDPMSQNYEVDSAVLVLNVVSFSSVISITTTGGSGQYQQSSSQPSYTATTLRSVPLSAITSPVSSTVAYWDPQEASSVVQRSASTSSPTGPLVTYALGSSVVAPAVTASNLLGTSCNDPSTQYVKQINSPAIQLAQDILVPGVNGDLSTNYGISAETGVLVLDGATQSLLTSLTPAPHLSRDGGKGGYLNGQRLFIFCDTGSYTQPTENENGNFLGFVSSSVAVDVGLNAASGNPLSLQDGIGEWSDNMGRMRGFAPMTDGEQAYNLVMQGNGYRYAVWPESSIIPLNQTYALIYAPIIYDDVNEVTKAAVFTYTGNTLLAISVPGEGGPLAERVVEKLFDEEEVEWGNFGGLRSWGPSGAGGNDGRIYVFGNVEGGILAGRVDVGSVTDRTSYEYWDGSSWSNTEQSTSSTAFLIAGEYMDGDIFYSPRHLTFIFVYLTPFADNIFYYRYLEADAAIVPDNASDYVENMFKYSWSDQQFLFKAGPGPTGNFIYAGGVQLGYFDDDDISNGGSKMLLSWTAPTGGDPAAMASEYLFITAIVEWA
ncbi:MAG: hypothetical protein M1827_007273 [Pycnora praestabilis]|nr:MAG: hypothetical protein M1827_007273 [Pycnora praestabilis]